MITDGSAGNFSARAHVNVVLNFAESGALLRSRERFFLMEFEAMKRERGRKSFLFRHNRALIETMQRSRPGSVRWRKRGRNALDIIRSRC